MASNIPTRRVTRATRAITVAKDNENANARPSRLATRTKPAIGTASGAADGPQGKRKREALGEVTSKAVNKSKNTDTKGKGKESIAVKPVKTTNVARPPVRQASTRTRSTTVVARDKVTDDNEHKMVVDPPTRPVPVVLLPAPAPKVKTKATRIKSSVSVAETVARIEAGRDVLPVASSHRTYDVFEEEEPVHKRRRTSSEFEEIPLEVIEEEGELTVRPTTRQQEEIVQIVEENNDWVDMENDDADDPLMVSEYSTEIFNYLRTIERTTMPYPLYMENQKELTWKMRGILVDWLIQVHSRFRLVSETLFLCVNLIDRFLSSRIVSLKKLQLVGVACMFIAAKAEETIAPSVTNFVYCADAAYTEAEVLKAERYILKTVDWNLSYPCPYNFLRRISKADNYDMQIRTVGKYLIEIGCLEWRLLATPPSLLAAAGMWLARLILNHSEWTPSHCYHSSYPEEALIPTAELIINYILKPVTHESFFKKFSSKRFMKVSLFVQSWALERWQPRSHVDLAADLPHLKAEARIHEAAAAESAEEEDEF